MSKIDANLSSTEQAGITWVAILKIISNCFYLTVSNFFTNCIKPPCNIYIYIYIIVLEQLLPPIHLCGKCISMRIARVSSHDAS